MNDFPLLGVYGVNHFHYRIEDKYFKGALMLNTLRHFVADDKLWFSTLKGIQADFWHSSIDTEALIAYFNEKLGADLNAFFYQYLQTTDIPVLTIQKMEPQGFKYKWSKSIESFNLPLKLADGKILQPATTWNTEATSSVNSQIAKELENRYLITVKWL